MLIRRSSGLPHAWSAYSERVFSALHDPESVDSRVSPAHDASTAFKSPRASPRRRRSENKGSRMGVSMSSAPSAPSPSTQSSTSFANDSDSARSPDRRRSVHRPNPLSRFRLNDAPKRTPYDTPPTALASARASPSAFGCFSNSSRFLASTASPYTANRRRTSRRVTHGTCRFESSAKNVSRRRYVGAVGVIFVAVETKPSSRQKIFSSGCAHTATLPRCAPSVTPYTLRSTSARIAGLRYTARPIMTPRNFPLFKCATASSTVSTPPLREKPSLGKSSASLCTSSYRSGGTLRLAVVLSPPSTAHRACTTKCSTPDAACTSSTNDDTKSYESSASGSGAFDCFPYDLRTPSLCLSVTGTSTASFMRRRHSPTKSVSSMSAAPNRLSSSGFATTLALGHPQFRFTSS
mmetsp:Transcript_4309/g.17157  ORF Transcript_4309/g.17157 Transcript_4309/m.17157 type:complete len:407 (+) Transcript_4309:709-1929(+)